MRPHKSLICPISIAAFLVSLSANAQSPEVSEELVKEAGSEEKENPAEGADSESVTEEEEQSSDESTAEQEVEKSAENSEGGSEVSGAESEASREDAEAEAEDEPASDEESGEEEQGLDEESALAAPPGVEGMWGPGEEPYRPPPLGMGVIWGRVMEPDTGEAALEPQIKVQGKKNEVFGDIDGYYRLELAPGAYTIEIYYPLHETETLANIVVVTGELSRHDTTLRSQEGAIDTVIIEEEAEKQSVEGLALTRQRSASQGDAVGREEISKTTDSNAAEAAQRIVGANIVGGRFVYVRGLGGRYSNSLLGGYPLPSPEPDRAAVPLDVFPTPILDSLTIVKTFTPDMPGDFAGGSVQIETRSVPDEPMLKISLSGGLNTQATFQERLNHPSSATDWLGFDSGMRSLPDSVPTDYPAKAQARKPDGSTISEEELVEPGRDMNSGMSPIKTRTPINHGIGIVGGNTWNIGQAKLGILASANYSHKYEKYEDVTLVSFDSSTDDPRGYFDRLNYEYDRGVEKIRWGTFGKLTLMPNDDHKISLTGLHSQLADDITTQYSGINREAEGFYQASQLDWVERGMTFGLLSGRHSFHSLRDAEFDWDLSIARAYRSEPDRRDTVYRQSSRISDPDDPAGRVDGWTYVNKTTSGRHFWAEQRENSSGGKVDWMQPILQGDDDTLSAKAGALVNIKRREFSVRRFQMKPTDQSGSPGSYACLGQTYQLDCPDRLFSDENIGPLLLLDESTQTTDAYDSELDVYAGYMMGDYEWHRKVRLAAGVRVEWTRQEIDPYNQFGDEEPEPGARLNSTDALPSISALYNAADKIKLRLAYGHTLARPQVRELAPFAFSDYFGGTVTSGNPDLVLTSIKNVDARFEFWPSLSELLAATVFYKYLRDPIESLQIPTGGAPQVTFRNADHAQVLGGELEARKNLGFMSSALLPFQVISNFTYTWSETQVEEDGNNAIITNPKRPLINQAPWVFNAALDYHNEVGTSARINYNVNGPTLVRVGTFRLPDAYARSFHSLDVSASQKFLEHWSVKASIENLINDKIQISQGKTLVDDDGEFDNVALSFTKGTTISLGVAYEL